MSNNYSEEFLELLNSIKAKRPRTVISHILKHGYITSQDLKDMYGYNHPPRAVRDVREQGIFSLPITQKSCETSVVCFFSFNREKQAGNSPAR